MLLFQLLQGFFETQDVVTGQEKDRGLGGLQAEPAPDLRPASGLLGHVHVRSVSTASIRLPLKRNGVGCPTAADPCHRRAARKSRDKRSGLQCLASLLVGKLGLGEFAKLLGDQREKYIRGSAIPGFDFGDALGHVTHCWDT